MEHEGYAIACEIGRGGKAVAAARRCLQLDQERVGDLAREGLAE